jgi:hypothetical protein
MLGVLLRADLYVTWKDQIFFVDVLVIDLPWETVILSVTNWSIGVVTKLNTIAKIDKYRRLHEGHHFILMAMEVHDAPKCDMNWVIREHARLFHDRQSKGHLCLYFCIQFFKHHVIIVL